MNQENEDLCELIHGWALFFIEKDDSKVHIRMFQDVNHL